MQFRSLYTGLATMHALKLLYRRSPGKTYNGYAVLKNKVDYKTIYIYIYATKQSGTTKQSLQEI